jgi:hypothetical protein
LHADELFARRSSGNALDRPRLLDEVLVGGSTAKDFSGVVAGLPELEVEVIAKAQGELHNGIGGVGNATACEDAAAADE